MTNKEAIDVLTLVNRQARNQPHEFYEALNLAIKALGEDETKGDLISREALKKVIETYSPRGEWIIVDDTEKFIVKCSVCGRIEDSRMIKYYPFCHCGARMKGEEQKGDEGV